MLFPNIISFSSQDTSPKSDTNYLLGMIKMTLLSIKVFEGLKNLSRPEIQAPKSSGVLSNETVLERLKIVRNERVTRMQIREFHLSNGTRKYDTIQFFQPLETFFY